MTDTAPQSDQPTPNTSTGDVAGDVNVTQTVPAETPPAEAPSESGGGESGGTEGGESSAPSGD